MRCWIAGLALGFLWCLNQGALAQPAPVQEQSVEFSGSEGGQPARLYIPRDGPPLGGRLPAVLVLHTAAGPGPNLDAFARKLAAEGFVILAPDLFSLHDFGPEGRTDHPLILRDLDGALEFLKAHPRVDPQRIGVVGFSFGGRLAILAAATHPRIRATVVYYAVASYHELAKSRPVAGRALAARPLTERAGEIRAPVLIHHGEADRTVPPEQGRLLHEALRAAGKTSSLHIYPGADHLFNFPLGQDATHHPEADRLSWERTLAFLRRHL